jgi:hypothetical protein
MENSHFPKAVSAEFLDFRVHGAWKVEIFCKTYVIAMGYTAILSKSHFWVYQNRSAVGQDRRYTSPVR